MIHTLVVIFCCKICNFKDILIKHAFYILQLFPGLCQQAAFLFVYICVSRAGSSLDNLCFCLVTHLCPLNPVVLHDLLFYHHPHVRHHQHTAVTCTISSPAFVACSARSAFGPSICVTTWLIYTSFQICCGKFI